ncbi:hydroxymethylglutaryl-CoA lyase [Aeromonas veronii]|uniref:hydroxymethylglutaryl-CoA lyase n=1 Tax=Aeromonas veronii TaxID=654 RepID=UPI00142F820A|nr:hydroxymethylglutaryl-CoA lyase [Aeromonas veronii]NJI18827.1 hydroxymethylglutaryl-CoA lyase [Aeromonas veronii]
MNKEIHLPVDRVSLVEMGPRDGLQNEARLLSLGQRQAFIERLAQCGLQRIEVGAFVSPKRVPQMADSAALFEALPRRGPTRYGALVPNLQGLQAAIAARADEIGLFTACSDGFTRANIGIGVEESLIRFAPLVQEARRLGIKVRGYLSTVIACPFDGPTKPKRVAALAERLLDLGCHEISLGDTIGVGTPGTVAPMLDAVLHEVPAGRLAVHFHDTYGQGVANLLPALERGIRTIDCSVAGLGGCPYAPGASGNIASEEVVYLLHGLGMQTGVNLDKLAATGQWVSELLGRPNGSRVGQALHANAERLRARLCQPHAQQQES